MDNHGKVLLALAKDRRLAHEVLFKHRHPLATPSFHGDMIDDFHGTKPQVVEEAARGFAKSTIGEEATAIMAEFTDFWNCVIVSSTERRAAERLEAVKHELENNENLINLFGQQTGSIWQANKAVLNNGVCLQAIGVGQSVRGVKHHDTRPDFLWIDDIEDEESVKSPEASRTRLLWLYGTLIPVCAKYRRIRVTGNRLSPDAVITKLADDKSWFSRRIPISYTDPQSGEETATWPELHDILWIREKRDEYERLGISQAWASEYMCEAISESAKPFKVENLRVFPQVRTWQPVQAFFDPAKTSKSLRHQAQYGKAVWSWVGRKLVVWEANGRPLKPSELIDDIFQTEEKYQPISLHVEADGLEDWLMEPLRFEQTKRRILLPHLFPERAPRDKDGFIRALEPYVLSNEIEFASDLPDLRAQFLNFPSGRKDIINALAYALKLKPGQPVYDDFTDENISENVTPHLRSKKYLCLNADGNYVTGCLVQYDGTLAVLADWIEQGDPGQVIETICKQASLTAGENEIIVPPKEFDRFENKGLVAALKRLPRDCRPGVKTGRAEIRDLLSKRSKEPLMMVSTEAAWTLRAFSGGYHKSIRLNGEPEPGAYATLMDGLESFAGIMSNADPEQEIGTFRTSRDGRAYRSLVGNR